MSALRPTDFTGRIVWLGRVDDRAATLVATPLDLMELTFAGPVGESHGGLTRPACSRVAAQYERGTEIRNVRQLSIVSAEEVTAIAAAIGLDHLPPAWLGASVMVAGIPDLSLIPPASRLQGQEGGATLTVDVENRPCKLPALEIEARRPGHGGAFRAAARHRRGVTAWVEREGTLHLGESLRLHIPAQPPWPHLGHGVASSGPV
ncbi:MAG TPA: sulfurase [Rhodobacteraceae bacterium]|jgi:hypothetical protein|nr:sulfurase [Paracoccaceae bacterium]